MSSFKCFGVVGTSQVGCTYYEDDYVLPDGSVWVSGSPPSTGPDRFGEYIVQSDGSFVWHKLPDPPFNVVYHEGKLKNYDTMAEISIETLPGNVAARLAALENPQP
ncbi:hypothetical protein [Pseudomonas saponiphila]|uniref:hypothetical protein n=1 Tax=Pseudomonas saponiphila TaxID=556534 RepID=UPI00115FFDBA|nr:hypothetical protein [Pseudomonas saponiphila]